MKKEKTVTEIEFDLMNRVFIDNRQPEGQFREKSIIIEVLVFLALVSFVITVIN